MFSGFIKNHQNCKLLDDEELRRFVQLEASSKATRLDYENQLLDHDEAAINQELDSAGGTKSIQVLWANLSKGFIITLIGLALFIIHFISELWALAWLEMGWMKYAIALGISASGAAGAALLLVGILLIFVQHKQDAYTVVLTFTAAFILMASIGVSATLGKFRADLAVMKINEADSPVIIQGEPVDVGTQSEEVSEFYDRNLPMLGFIFPLMAVIFNLTSGVLIHTGADKMYSSAGILLLIRKRNRITQLKVHNTTERETIKEMVETQILQAKDLQKIEKDKAEKEQKKVAYRRSPEFKSKKIAFWLVSFMVSLLILFIFVANSRADTVVGIDVSLSEDQTSVTGKNSLEANKRMVESAIHTLTPGETIHVVGITANSRADPWIIFSARIGKDPGFFSEKLKKGRAIIVASWRHTARGLKLFSKNTDILGFMEIASDLLRHSERKRLILLSDGKNCTQELNLEKVPTKAGGFMDKLDDIQKFPDLTSTKCYWYGAGGPGTSRIHLSSLEEFWHGFMQRSKGKLLYFSSLRR